MLATNSDQRRVAASRGTIRAQNWTQTSQNTENFDRENKTQNHTLIDFEGKKKFGPFLDLCVSSLRRGHANLLCIVPILSDVPKDKLLCSASRYKLIFTLATERCGTSWL
jgi:hypothetical protein